MEERRISTRDGVTLAASYSHGDERTMVALHPAASGTRDHHLFRHLHRLLPAKGTGVATFDRRGEGASAGESSRGRFGVQVADALAVCGTVPQPVGLWGFSQGAWVAPLAAAQSQLVQFLVLIASVGVTPAEQMEFANVEQLRRNGYGAEVVDHVLDLRRRFEVWAHGDGSDDAQLAEELSAAASTPWSDLVYLPRALPDAEGRRRWIEEMDFDPRPVFAEVTVPTLLFYGADDEWAPVDPSVRAWRDARGDDVDIVVIPDAGHDLTLPDGALAPAYEDELVEWLARL